MSRVAASIERKPSEVPSDAYNGICSRLEDTSNVGIEGKEFIESPVSRARPQLTSPEYQKRNSVVNRKVKRFRRSGGFGAELQNAKRAAGMWIWTASQQ